MTKPRELTEETKIRIHASPAAAQQYIKDLESDLQEAREKYADALAARDEYVNLARSYREDRDLAMHKLTEAQNQAYALTTQRRNIIEDLNAKNAIRDDLVSVFADIIAAEKEESERHSPEAAGIYTARILLSIKFGSRVNLYKRDDWKPG